MKGYLDETFQNIGNAYTWPVPSPPPTLKWLQGGTLCLGDFQITNTSKSAIQVESIGVGLQASAQNTTQYHLVDICLQHAGCVSRGGQTSCLYTAQVSLSRASKGTPFEGTLTSLPAKDPSCPTPLVLQSEDETEIQLVLQNGENVPTTYQVVPLLTVRQSEGPSTLTLSLEKSLLAFTNRSQFSCMSLRGNQIVQEKPEPMSSNTTLCV